MHIRLCYALAAPINQIVSNNSFHAFTMNSLWISMFNSNNDSVSLGLDVAICSGIDWTTMGTGVDFLSSDVYTGKIRI